MRKLIKANNSRKDSVEAYACRCTCNCSSDINSRLYRAEKQSISGTLGSVGGSGTK